MNSPKVEFLLPNNQWTQSYQNAKQIKKHEQYITSTIKYDYYYEKFIDALYRIEKE